ncbi:MAG TPA: TonB-dependent receptor [Vicinamibacterales bacterium]|nr:TonB-dependent receptor [Vicinamibacterales bacterium]
MIPLCVACFAASQAPMTLAGAVVDGRTGAPLEKVLVVVEDTGQSAQTGADGRFAIPGVVAGPHHLYVSVVGYALLRREVTIGPDPSSRDVLLRLSEGTTAYSETVTVTPDAFRATADAVPSSAILGSADLMNLRGVLADDPLRAVQVLPGVATGDDLRSEFTVRGSDFRHITFTLDGFATPYLLHTVRGVEDRGPTGSVAMINSDVIDEVTLLNGGYPQRYSGHTGSEVDFRLRDGSRDRRTLHVAVSGTNAGAVAEGPIGGARRGSWLVSARQSYLDLIVHRITDSSASFGFTDAQGRVAYDLSPRHRVDLTVLAGRSRFENDPIAREIDDLHAGLNASVVGVAGWRFTTPRLVLSQRLLAADNRFHNENSDGVELDKGRDRQFAWRGDVTAPLASTLEIGGGGEVERRDDSRVRRRLAPNRVDLVQLDDYSGDALLAGGYVSARWKPHPSITIAPGVRGDRWTLTDQSTTSPWIQTEWRPSRGPTVRASAGRYQQFADFENVLGVSGGVDLQPERAAQYDLGLEQRIGHGLRVTATLYDREEHEMLRRPGLETRLVGTRVVRGSAAARYDNRLEGFARGVELMLQRTTSGRGVSGWLSYAYGRNRYHDVVNGESFWGDFDQRHTLNAWASYRHSDRASFVGKLRMGSNFPIPGYYAESDGAYRITDVRNTTRLPLYSRLDLRANRTFNWSRRRLTLFAEVINVLNRDNLRFGPPRVSLITGQTTRPFDTMIPIVPSAGVLIEF